MLQSLLLYWSLLYLGVCEKGSYEFLALFKGLDSITLESSSTIILLF